jgi:tRNA modification GTPase
MLSNDIDTICAIATPPGRSGIGIVRVSGPATKTIAQKMLGFCPPPRKACFTNFLDADSKVIDQGLALFFESPSSFTGEDVLELQGHGGVFVLNNILKATIENGARMARPGEFSERSFINSKMDLAQLEAVADLIDASTEQAARSALRTLEGDFSRLINQIVDGVTQLRVYLEAAIDFTDEEIDFLTDGHCIERLSGLIDLLNDVRRKAKQGSILREGMNVAIAGQPNAGKSSLLNALSGRDSAIVTSIPGTTRDVLTELIDIDGIPVHIVDTAGLRESRDVVEVEGIKRARKAIDAADIVLLIIDCHQHGGTSITVLSHFGEEGVPKSALSGNRAIVIFNKTDLLTNADKLPTAIKIGEHEVQCLSVSAKSGSGLDELRTALKNRVGFTATEEGIFTARQRHLDALERTDKLLSNAFQQLNEKQTPELVAEDLRIAQQVLGEITGEFTSDDLLGEIFSNFCIGK